MHHCGQPIGSMGILETLTSSGLCISQSIGIVNPLKHHETIWLRPDTESHNLPSTEARDAYGYFSATQNDMDLPGTHIIPWHVLTLLIPISALTTHGWKRENGELGIQWDSPENLTKSKERVEYVLSGCKCKTGCTNKRCKCFKQERRCGPGCKCVNCMNTQSNHLLEEDDVHDLVLSEQCHSNSEDDYVETDCEEDEETNEIINEVFGPDNDTEDVFV